MKVAIFHDFFGAVGGAEKVTLCMAKALGADVITTDTRALGVLELPGKCISLGETMKIPPLKQVSATMMFLNCDFSDEYDFFIFSGNWAQYAGKKHHPNLWYCHSPTRAFYDLYSTYLSRQNLVRRQFFRIWANSHRILDQRSIRYMDSIVANSENVRTRIKRFYHRDASIIYPPIDTSSYPCKEYGNFWLSVNRLYPEKRIELQTEAFRSMPDERLIIVGGYSEGDHAAPYVNRIRRDLPENVELRGEISEKELVDLYAQCKGFITTARDEDFGMAPVEAMAAGKSVVAVNEGGYRESVIDGVTGFLVPAEVPAIVGAVRTVSANPELYRQACLARAKMFDRSAFEEQIRRVVNDAS
ncbi:MAG: glycosyltransferase [Methanomicrobiales archaeon]|nr:glycosyltransferase [Methanomicrobiales archaeon]MDI6876921.1 glycosyltransferase [Methanomicrobiales archaeon]